MAAWCGLGRAGWRGRRFDGTSGSDLDLGLARAALPPVVPLQRPVEVAGKADAGCLSRLDLVSPPDPVGSWATGGEKVAAAVLLWGGYGWQWQEIVGVVWCHIPGKNH